MQSGVMIRRFYSHITAISSSSSSSSLKNPISNKKKLVFLGSPQYIQQVSVSVLDKLLNASTAPDSLFEVTAIVTQPPSRKGRGRKLTPSPVGQVALERGFTPDLIFTPEKAGEEIFLSNLSALQPEVCVTSAYGNILPSKFLKIPPLGTINIHPSMLPLYRGAAPIQRALQDGVKETGVSLVYTVRAMDAGPIIACERVKVDDHVKAPELMALLFDQGSELLIRELPSIIDGSARLKAHPQDDSKATLAPKLSPEESWLSFDQEAIVLHNKVRAFAGWPGTRARVRVVNLSTGHESNLEFKVITTRVCDHSNSQGDEKDDVTFVKGALVFPCGGHSALEVLEILLPGKKIMTATAFWNGLRGRKLKKL
ncbi:hypothetical protein AQUCO_00201228v1 [Aquilegia coerulea]|uniref:Methionyl-tRNA formyltransferase, mitochondrial n=1 Tax=Aquilegia coerulea TaxID=218851 RepID=A0A2G5F6T4_AQUCA|nr:hypothetical protein AQUCO_00201228v1 [Aquilegia coerulea]